MSILTSSGKIISVGGKGLTYTPPWATIGKGDIIKMNLDGSEREYRVLKKSGSVVEVMTMWNISDSTAFDSNGTNTYAGNTLDTYLNTTWYNTLTSTAKNAIVPKNINQYQYSYSNSAYNQTTHSSYANYSTKALKANVGNRYVYALDVEDIEMYFGGTGGSVNDKIPATFSKTDLLQMFWNQTSTISEYPWLRSANASSANGAWTVNGYYGRVDGYGTGATSAVRGALQIDLSLISFTPPPIVDKGDLITMDLGIGEKQYRVLKCEGNVAEVVTMQSVKKNIAYDSNKSRTYSGSTLDIYLNTTWYNTLSVNAKRAIVAKDINQYQYAHSDSVYDAETHASYADYSTKTLEEQVGKRYAYALDVEDIENYFSDGVFSLENFRLLFWNKTTYDNDVEGPWLRSSNTGSLKNYPYFLNPYNGVTEGGGWRDMSTARYARAAFCINLTKIPFTKSV